MWRATRFSSSSWRPLTPTGSGPSICASWSCCRLTLPSPRVPRKTTPLPIFDPKQETSYLKDFMVFFRPGDIVKFTPIGREEYDAILADVAANRFTPKIR